MQVLNLEHWRLVYLLTECNECYLRKYWGSWKECFTIWKDCRDYVHVDMFLRAITFHINNRSSEASCPSVDVTFPLAVWSPYSTVCHCPCAIVWWGSLHSSYILWPISAYCGLEWTSPFLACSVLHFLQVHPLMIIQLCSVMCTIIFTSWKYW